MVVLISIDTCRADYLSCYGHPKKTTPNIDAVADEGILFTHAISPVPITLPAHCSMLTGKTPLSHGVHDNLAYRLTESHVTLAEILRENGYATAGIVAAFVLDSQFGISQGFDLYDDRFDAAGPTGVASIVERKGGEVTERACRWLERNRDQDFFLFLHYFDPHADYDPPEPFATAFDEDPYAGEIAYTDHCIGKVLAKLRELGSYDQSLIVIVGDHGESLGEHGESAHDYFIYQSTLRVPLIVKLPNAQEPRRVDGIASIVDVMPTILGHARIPVPGDVHGQDLSRQAPAENAPTPERILYCESLTPTKYGCSPLLGIVSDHWKYIEAPRPELYDLRTDPDEYDNLVDREVGRASALCRELTTLIAGHSAGSADAQMAVDEQTRERLESLGYVAGRSVDDQLVVDPSRMDPKDLIGFHEDFQQALGFIRSRQFERARVLCQRMLAEQPGVADVHILSGDIEFEAGDMRSAADHYSRFLASAASEQGTVASASSVLSEELRLSPNYVRAHYNLANTLAAVGERKLAVEHYREALQIDPQHVNARYNLAITLGQMRKLDAAIVEFRTVIGTKPDLAEAHYNLGYALAHKAEYAGAVGNYVEALRIRPDYAEAHLGLGDALAALGRIDEATAHFEEAARLRPDLPEAHYKTARGLLAAGETARAIAVYRSAIAMFPASPIPANELAWILATHEDQRFRNGAEARSRAERACQLAGGRHPVFLHTLAAAFAELSDFDRAISIEREALALLQEAGGPAEFAAAIRGQIDAYQHRRPARTSF